MNMKRLKVKAVAWITIISFGLYILTDITEILQSGLSPVQLMMTYAAMAAIPFSVLGLYSLDEEAGGPLYLSGAALIAVSFIYFSGTATYGIAEKSADYGVLIERLGTIYYAHGVILVAGGILFGTALYRKRLAPRPIAAALILASLLSFATGLFGLDELFFVIANFIRNGSFVALGIYTICTAASREN